MRESVPKHVTVGDNSWDLGDGGPAPILAWHPQIEDGEDYEFWLYRLAAGYGLSKGVFCKRVPGIDYDPEIASAITGIPIERLSKGIFRALEGLQPSKLSAEFYKTLRKIGHQDQDSWLTWHLPYPAFRGGEFCPLCLNERPVFRLNWNISLFVSCSKHGCLLSHLCGSCGRTFTGYQYLRNVDLSERLETARECSHCHGSVAKGIRFTPVAPEVAYLEALHAELATQGRCIHYFSAVRRLLEELSEPYWDFGATGRMRAALLQYPRNGYFDLFEKAEPEQRQNYLLAMMDLFTDWPYIFVEVLAGHGIKFNHRFFPRWLKSAIGLAKKYDPRQVRSVRAQFWEAAQAEGWLDAARFLSGEMRWHSTIPMIDFSAARLQAASRIWHSPKPGRPKRTLSNSQSKRSFFHAEARARISAARKRRQAAANETKQGRDGRADFG